MISEVSFSFEQRSIFAVSIIYGIKLIIVQMLEGFFYEDLWDKINSSVLHEQLLIQLEKSHVDKDKRRGQQVTAFLRPLLYLM
jgi:hypothetical protein